MSEVSEPVLLRAARMIVSSGRLSRDDDQEAWDMVCALGHDSMPLAKAYISAMELLIVREGMSDAEGTARAMLGATGSYPTKQIESIISGLLSDIDGLRKDSGRTALMRAVTLEHHEIEQVLAQALGTYPRYADDPKTFPDVLPEDQTVFVGVEDSLTLAMEAADEIKRLRTELEGLKSVDRALSIETLAREKAAAEGEVKRLKDRVRRDRGGYGASSDGDWDAE